MGFEAIEAFLPLSDMLVNPGLSFPEGLRLDPAGSHPACLPRTDESAVFEDAHVLQKRRQCNPERLGQFTDGPRSFAELADNCPPGRICEGGERHVQVG